MSTSKQPNRIQNPQNERFGRASNPNQTSDGTVQRINIRRRSSVDSISTPRSSANTPIGLDGAPDLMFTPRANTGGYRRVTTTERDAALYNMAQALVPVLNTPDPQSSGGLRYWPFGTGTDLPLVPPPIAPGLLPDVKMSDFADYIRVMADKQRRFEESRQVREEDMGDGERRLSLVDIAAGKTPHVAGEGLVKAMEGVPNMFFSEEFSLSRPETWQMVCPSDDQEEQAERVEEYGALLDVVETQLLQEIAVRSDHFFEAAAVVQDLGDNLGRAYEHVHSLRTGVRSLDEDVLRAAVDVQRLQKRRANLVAVADKLKVVEDVANFQEALGLLLPQGDFAGALDVCDDLRGTLASNELEGLHVARHLPEHLSKTSEAINDLMETQFLAALRHPCLPAVVEEALLMLEQPGTLPDVDPIGLSAALEGVPDRDALLPLVLGLWRAGRLEGALARLRDDAAADVKAAMREVVERGVPLLVQGPNVETDSLAEKLLALSSPAFSRLLRALTVTAASCLEHSAAVQGLVGDAVQAQGGVPRAQLAALRALCSDVVQGTADAAHQRWVKLLGSRAAVHARLRLPELTEVLMLSEGFANIAQNLGAKPGVALRNAVQGQCKAFLETLHSRSLTHLSGLLEQETWVGAEVPHQAQRLVDCLEVRAAALEVEENAQPIISANGAAVTPAEPLSVLLASEGSASGAAAAASPEPDSRLAVGGKRYVVVRAVLALLRLLQDYAAFQETVPALAAEVAYRVVELVKVFNSRTCQLVLGAGAMQLAGLKSITAKHLALSAQCLGALIALQPTLTTVFTAPVPGPRRSLLLPDFQRAGQDLSIHRSEIHSKLVSIMRERLAANLKQLPAMAAQWGGGPPSPRSPSAFAQTTAKQLRILSQVLSPMLLEQELFLIFGQVALLFSNTLADAFSRLEPQDAGWEAQCSADAEHLLETLRSLPLDPNQRVSNVERLAAFCATRFVNLASASSGRENAPHAADEGHLPIDATATHSGPPPTHPPTGRAPSGPPSPTRRPANGNVHAHGTSLSPLDGSANGSLAPHPHAGHMVGSDRGVTSHRDRSPDAGMLFVASPANFSNGVGASNRNRSPDTGMLFAGRSNHAEAETAEAGGGAFVGGGDTGNGTIPQQQPAQDPEGVHANENGSVRAVSDRDPGVETQDARSAQENGDYHSATSPGGAGEAFGGGFVSGEGGEIAGWGAEPQGLQGSGDDGAGDGRTVSRVMSDVSELTYARRESYTKESRSVSMRSTLDPLETLEEARDGVSAHTPSDLDPLEEASSRVSGQTASGLDPLEEASDRVSGQTPSNLDFLEVASDSVFGQTPPTLDALEEAGDRGSAQTQSTLLPLNPESLADLGPESLAELGHEPVAEQGPESLAVLGPGSSAALDNESSGALGHESSGALDHESSAAGLVEDGTPGHSLRPSAESSGDWGMALGDGLPDRASDPQPGKWEDPRYAPPRFTWSGDGGPTGETFPGERNVESNGSHTADPCDELGDSPGINPRAADPRDDPADSLGVNPKVADPRDDALDSPDVNPRAAEPRDDALDSSGINPRAAAPHDGPGDSPGVNPKAAGARHEGADRIGRLVSGWAEEDDAAGLTEGGGPSALAGITPELTSGVDDISGGSGDFESRGASGFGAHKGSGDEAAGSGLGRSAVGFEAGGSGLGKGAVGFEAGGSGLGKGAVGFEAGGSGLGQGAVGFAGGASSLDSVAGLSGFQEDGTERVLSGEGLWDATLSSHPDGDGEAGYLADADSLPLDGVPNPITDACPPPHGTERV